LRIILTLFAAFFIISCSKTSKENKNQKNSTENNISVKTIQQQRQNVEKDETKMLQFGNLTLTFKNGELVYPHEKTVILLEGNNTYSKAQEGILDKLGIKYYKTSSEFLKEYFEIHKTPSIVVLENNKTVKYENFTPYEILKAEGF